MSSSYERRHGDAPSGIPHWTEVYPSEGPLHETNYHKCEEGIAKITIDRPERRNAFTPRTVQEMSWCFRDARDDINIGVVLLRGQGDHAFCSGGDQDYRTERGYADDTGMPRLNVLDLQVQMRRLPKPIIALVNGYAVGGGHVLHMVCDLTLAGDGSRFGQTGPRVGSVDAGYGCTHMANIVGQKKAREMWFLCKFYSANEAERMGLVNAVVSSDSIEDEGARWAREILRASPTAIRLSKHALNAAEDGQAGQQSLAGDATLLLYHHAEAGEGRTAFQQRRAPDYSSFPWLP